MVDAAWLERHHYSSALRSKYVKNGWLEQVTRGVYRRPLAALSSPNEETALRWQNVVVSLQTLLGYPVIVGGRTALELHGFTHYLSTRGPQAVQLYTAKPLPGWVAKLPLDTQFVFHNAHKLFSIPVSTQQPDDSLQQKTWGQNAWPLILSSPERAILELLDALPRHESFHQAAMLMEALSTLSPRRLNTLLVDCRSVKVKRLFLWFAEHYKHAWLKRLELSNVTLGSGKRMIARGGKLDPKFNITVPENIDAAE